MRCGGCAENGPATAHRRELARRLAEGHDLGLRPAQARRLRDYLRAAGASWDRYARRWLFPDAPSRDRFALSALDPSGRLRPDAERRLQAAGVIPGVPF